MTHLKGEVLGQGPVWVLLHGLFGEGSNWRSFARRLKGHFCFVMPDLCNHGASPRSPKATLQSMAAEVKDFVDRLGVEPCGILGHSMGGKVAMQYVADYPYHAQRLVVVDIAPRYYHRDFSALITAMRKVDLSAGRRRADLDADLAMSIRSVPLRQFLLKGAVRDHQGFWRWKFGLDEIELSYDAIRKAPAKSRRADIPSMFVCGQTSDFVRPDDLGLIRQWFPQSVTLGIEGAGHWVHGDQPDAFIAAVLPFMASLP